jgi:hypothetical protein
MLRNAFCLTFLALTLIGAADIARSASTHLATFLAASAADAALPTRSSPLYRTTYRATCSSDRMSAGACEPRLQVASRY